MHTSMMKSFPGLYGRKIRRYKSYHFKLLGFCYFCTPLVQEDNMQIKDLQFKKFISKSKVQQQVNLLAEQINSDYKDKSPVFLPILNGSFMFAGDLIKQIELPCRVSFVKSFFVCRDGKFRSA